MNISKINYAVDVLMAIDFAVCAVTGLLLKFVLSAEGSAFFGFSKEIFTKMHDVSGIALIVLVAVHLVLHWNWIVGMTKQIFFKK